MEVAWPPLADVPWMLTRHPGRGGAGRRPDDQHPKPHAGRRPALRGAAWRVPARINEGAQEELVTRQPGYGTVGMARCFDTKAGCQDLLVYGAVERGEAGIPRPELGHDGRSERANKGLQQTTTAIANLTRLSSHTGLLWASRRVARHEAAVLAAEPRR
jgi:hypothetical protein